MEIRDGDFEPNDATKKLAQWIESKGHDIKIMHENDILVYKESVRQKSRDFRHLLSELLEDLGLEVISPPCSLGEVRESPQMVQTVADQQGRGVEVRYVSEDMILSFDSVI